MGILPSYAHVEIKNNTCPNDCKEDHSPIDKEDLKESNDDSDQHKNKE